MIRRWLRIGVRLGILAGIGLAVSKLARSRRTPPPLPQGADPWAQVDRARTDLVPPRPAREPGPASATVAGPDGQAAPDTVQPAPEAAPEAPPPAASVEGAWVEVEGTECPPTHPVKAKASSSIYHLPGMMAYERTRPDRCYRDAASAEADGYRAAKR